MRPGRMLFHRDFRQYTGGHGKVWDYFNHALALGWDARVYLSPQSRRDASNPWLAYPERIEQHWQPMAADVLFLAGMDWQALADADAGRPVINLIQALRHADDDPALPLRQYLARPATRICVSAPIAEAIAATGLVNGRVEVIPAALDLPPGIRALPPAQRRGVLILATKQRALGQALAETLAANGLETQLILDDIPRPSLGRAMAAAAQVICLPMPREGFYLPGLEAMALQAPLLMPDAVGNREYAQDGVNCLMPAASVDALRAASLQLLGQPALAATLVENGVQTAARHTLHAERAAFAKLLSEVLP